MQNKHGGKDYSEWFEKIKKASDAVAKPKIEDEEEKKGIQEENAQNKKFLLLISILLFILSFVPRIYFIFFVSNPDNPGAGWFGDSYHHWQIAYLTKEIGLSHGFLRLWDLKGMEYFWGLLHPLIIMTAFWITGNNSVGMERAVTAFFGSISVVLIFFIVRKFWNTKAAAVAALFAALNPIGIFNDGTGMVEPLGIPFLLLGVLLWPSSPFIAGASLAIALMARGEYWVFSVGIVAAMVIFTKKIKSDKKIQLVLSFMLLLGIYMKYLLNWTGNFAYPFYQNYVANIYGTWQLKPYLTLEDIQAKYTFLSIFIVSFALIALVLWKRPKGMYVYLLGLGNWLFLGATFGLGAYIKSYASYVWYVRFMILPYAFLGIVISVALFYLLPRIKYLKILESLKLNWIIFFGILVTVQSFWYLIRAEYSKTAYAWDSAVKTSDQIASIYSGGGMLLVEGNPEITYALVRFHGVQGKNITGEMFDPYFYFKEDPYKDWSRKRKVVLRWLKDNNVRFIVTYVQYERYRELVAHEPQFFSEGIPIINSNIIIYKVKDALYTTKI